MPTLSPGARFSRCSWECWVDWFRHGPPCVSSRCTRCAEPCRRHENRRRHLSASSGLFLCHFTRNRRDKARNILGRRARRKETTENRRSERQRKDTERELPLERRCLGILQEQFLVV